MKLQLVIFAICIGYTLSEETTKVIGKGYPKKYRSYINGKILINAAKYEKGSNPPVARSYTAFQFVGPNPKMVQAGVPDSPYFPEDQGYDQKSRSKKVLQLESPWSLLRHKRSAVLDVSPVEKDVKKIETKAAEVEKVIEVTPMPTAAAEVTTVKTSSSPTEYQEESKSTTSTTQINTIKAKSATDVPIERAGKTKSPVRKGKSQPKPKAAPNKKSGRVSGNSKPKPKGKNAAAGRAKPKGKQAKSAKKPKGNQIARKRDNKRKGNAQKGKQQKATPAKQRSGKIPKGKPVQPTPRKNKPK